MVENVRAAEGRWGLGAATKKILCPGTSCTTLGDFAPTAEAIIKLPWLKPPLSMNDRGASRGASYAVNAKRREIRQTVTLLARSRKLPRNCRYSRVTLHYLPADNRRRDTDNLVATLKPICDGLAMGAAGGVGYGLVPDDTPQYMAKVEPIIYQRQPGQKPAMWLQIECWDELPEGIVPPYPAPDWLLHA